MENTLSVVVSKEDKHFVARGVEIELASQGDTIEDALQNIKEAFALLVKHTNSSKFASP